MVWSGTKECVLDGKARAAGIGPRTELVVRVISPGCMLMLDWLYETGPGCRRGDMSVSRLAACCVAV